MLFLLGRDEIVEKAGKVYNPEDTHKIKTPPKNGGEEV
jgi:hypothetical protein